MQIFINILRPIVLMFTLVCLYYDIMFFIKFKKKDPEWEKYKNVVNKLNVPFIVVTIIFMALLLCV